MPTDVEDDRARVVIIGGGVAGMSIAYHLTKLGWNDVLLLDRSELTSGSTFHSAGLVAQLRNSVSHTRMMMDGVELYPKLEAETGVDVGWHQVGTLHLASSPYRLEALARQRQEQPGQDGLSRLLAARGPHGESMQLADLRLELHHMVIAGLIVYAEFAATIEALDASPALPAAGRARHFVARDDGYRWISVGFVQRESVRDCTPAQVRTYDQCRHEGRPFTNAKYPVLSAADHPDQTRALDDEPR